MELAILQAWHTAVYFRHAWQGTLKPIDQLLAAERVTRSRAAGQQQMAALSAWMRVPVRAASPEALAALARLRQRES